MTSPLTYAGAGVNIDTANQFVRTIRKIVRQTPRSGVLGEIGGFGGMFSLNLSNIEKPVLVSSTDGVGTKLKIAIMLNRHDTIGIDLVAMSVNDVIVQGAKVLFFLDYLSMGKLDVTVAEAIISGIAEGCRMAHCALIGGETAEMPDIYKPGEYDLAGFAVGIADNDQIIDGSEISVGHKLIGLASSGLHSNGYSLARKICFEHLGLKIDQYVPELGRSIGEELLTPTRIYVRTIESLTKDLPIHGLAHITGGGLADNLVRIIPQACAVAIKKGSWEVPPVFSFLKEAGRVEEAEMLRTFNNGIDFVAIVPEKSAQEILERLTAMEEKAFIIGEIVEKGKKGQQLLWT